MQKVITVDGPSGSGKGSLCQLLAKQLGWSLLDSGALYRIVGLAAERRGVDFADAEALATLAAGLKVRFEPGVSGEPSKVILDNEDISSAVRAETTGSLASQVAVHGAVRDALLGLQREFAGDQGLIADGRDMGTVVFPHAPLKIYLTASAEERANRRYKQLKDSGQSVNLAALLEDIQTRDERDINREVAPLRPAADAVIIDSSLLAIEDVLKQVLAAIEVSPLRAL